MSTTVKTVANALAVALQDPNYLLFKPDGVTGYQRFVYDYCEPEATWPLQRMRSGLWIYRGGPLAIDGPTDSSPGFTESGGTPYVLNAAGGYTHTSTVSLTGGAADTRDSIDVTGCRVRFAECLEALLRYIANHRAEEYSQSVAGSSISPETARRELLDQASRVRGAQAFG